MVNNNNEFQDFVAAMEAAGYEIDGSQLSVPEKELVGRVYNAAIHFIEDNQLAVGSEVASMEKFDKPVTTLNRNVRLSDIGHDAILDMCQAAEIGKDQLYTATCAVAAIFTNSTDNIQEHLSTERFAVADSDYRPLNTWYSSNAIASFTQDGKMAMEAFGKDIDKIVTDLKVNLTVTMLRFHWSLLDRIMFRKQCSSNTVQLTIQYDEVYDLAKISSPNASKERNFGKHRVPFIHLYRWPDTANTQAKRIEVLKANDTGTTPVLNANNEILFGVQLNLFDMALDGTKYGYNHVDMSDLVSEGAKFEYIFVDIKGEIFKLAVRTRHSAGFLERNNNRDSSDRVAVVEETFILDSNTPLANGTNNSVLAAFNDGKHFLRIKVNATGKLTLKTGELNANASVSAEAGHRDGEDILQSVKTAFEGLTFEPKYFTIDARYNEENMRRTTSAVRSHQRTIAFDIPVGKNYLMDYSLGQQQPERVLDTISRATALGNDVKGISLIEDCITDVAERIKEEEVLGDFSDYWDKVVYEYAAGMRCLPFVYKGTLDLKDVKNEKASELMSDVRGVADKFFIELFAKLYTFSMYRQALDNGETPLFKIITSSAVLASVFNIEHMHPHLDHRIAGSGKDSDFTRTFSDGTVAKIVTSTWERLVDKMIIIPFREKHPDDTLNFGINMDRGSFVAHYAPTSFGATFRRIAVNSRELVYPTNPVAAMVEVKNISKVYDGMRGLVKS